MLHTRTGIGPNVGTETCDIVDFTYSNEWLLRITGDARVHGDRLEKAFHNAAPGAINRTFSGHVYHQSPNLVATSRGYNNMDQQGDHAWRMEWFHATPCCTGAFLVPDSGSDDVDYAYHSIRSRWLYQQKLRSASLHGLQETRHVCSRTTFITPGTEHQTVGSPRQCTARQLYEPLPPPMVRSQQTAASLQRDQFGVSLRTNV